MARTCPLSPDKVCGEPLRTCARFNANGNLTVAVERSTNLQGMLFYTSPQELPQGRRSASVMSSVGVRRKLFNNKATVNLRVQDPFELAWMSFETRDRTHLQIARKDCSMHSATLSASYNFGRRLSSRISSIFSRPCEIAKSQFEFTINIPPSNLALKTQ